MDALPLVGKNYACPLCAGAIANSAEACPTCGMPQTAYRELRALPERHFTRGMRLMQRGSHDEALEHFFAARRLQPDKTEGLKRTVSCLMSLGRYEYALQTLMTIESPDAENLALRASCVRAIDEEQNRIRAALPEVAHLPDDPKWTHAVSATAVVDTTPIVVSKDTVEIPPVAPQMSVSASQKRKRDTRSRRKAKQRAR